MKNFKGVIIKSLQVTIYIVITTLVVTFFTNTINTAKVNSMVKEHAHLIAKAVWDFSPNSAVEYLSISAKNNDYKSVTVFDETGKKFLTISADSLKATDKQLALLGLIPVRKTSETITINSQEIGILEIEWYQKTIYVIFYAEFLLILLGIVVWVAILLKKSEAEHRTLYEASLVGLWKFNIQSGKIIKANRSLLNILKCESIEDIYKHTDFIDYLKQELIKQNLSQQGFIQDFEGSIRVNDVNCDILMSIIFSPNHKCLEGSIIDISDRKRNEEDLHKSRSMLQLVLDTIPPSIFWKDTQGNLLGYNKQFAYHTNINTTQACDMISAKDINWPEEEEKFFEDINSQVVASNKPIYQKVQQFNISGKEKHYKYNVLPLHDSKKHLSGTLCIYEDITSHKIEEEKTKQLEQELLKAHKLESIGTLAAGIAHEINTPIQFIRDNTVFLEENVSELFTAFDTQSELCEKEAHQKKQLEKLNDTFDIEFLKEEIPAAITESIEGLDRVAEIVAAMKGFSHMGGKDKTEENINQAIESTLAVSKNEWKYVAEIELHLDKNLPMVDCFIGEIKQVILNIIINAAHAIGDKYSKDSNTRGIISVSTYVENNSAVIEISDTGSGIPIDIQDKIFDPFFTTKDVGKGTGQGLSIAYQAITEKHGGELSFESFQETGTTFYVKLPL